MKYVKRNADIPVPDILAWDDDASNPVGCEYIVMSHAEGIELRNLWFDLDISIQLKCIVNISRKLADMARLEFPAYGSLYMRESSAVVSATLLPINDEFGIGPSCGKTYWDCTPGESRYYDCEAPDRGPWTDIVSFVDGLVNAGLSRLPPSDMTDCQTRRKYQGTASEHRELLHSTRKVLHELLGDARMKDNATQILVHPDLHMSNIFVDPNDPTKITSIIDWQSACIEPVFMITLPILDFAIPVDYLTNKKDPKEHDKRVKMVQIWNQALEACLYPVPRIGPFQKTKIELSRAFDIDLFRPFNVCHRTWRDGTPLLTSDLIDLAAQWKTLELPGRCPCTAPTDSEFDIHKMRRNELADIQEFRDSISKELHADDEGWVPAERWEYTQELHKYFSDEMLEMARKPGAEMTEDDVRTLWPFDPPY
ncbi:hypothetical protein QM012_004194 [Aureobasidium pullulans]|uniref:Altered inheritance of mitochondria protein 9, mitochondrial n=1 Tax=Aureobasidium pullulans TaxID=5580 RepID=A0ABR0TSE6_AURPU